MCSKISLEILKWADNRIFEPWWVSAYWLNLKLKSFLITQTSQQRTQEVTEIETFIAGLCISGIKRDPDIETESNVDLTDLLGIAGVPTFLFIHQEGKSVLKVFVFTKSAGFVLC